ncbi:hypothetical protein FA95DRAFT_1683343 [Auriscalpium vulgare]|uniref:Uncharacterized protein n=1 Tax=Auriscalpium vulgare TaxID=40419 RepID=A0ACB8RAN0_9AGAM|nr:hypothetical protein FA95DRAFT_1683343 [Auriscalpium vulgare]
MLTELVPSQPFLEGATNTFWETIVRSRIISTVSTVTDRYSRAAALDVFDADEIAMHRALRVLRAARNAVLPSHRLPPELLSHIFSLCAVDADAWWDMSPPRLGWVIVAHVCRHWRAVALECSGLWADNVTFTRGEQWFHEILRRANGLPLCIDTSYIKFDTEAVLALVVANLASTRELRIGDDIMMALIDSDLPPSSRLLSEENTAPLLDTLVIYDNDEDYEAPSLSQLGSCAPNLRQVYVTSSYVELPWTSSLLKNLTVLNVKRSCPPSDQTDKMDDVFSALQRMPLLESLRIIDFLPVAGAAKPGDTITLLHLTEFELGGSTRPSMTLLRAVVAPNCTVARISLFCDVADDVLATHSEVLAWLKKHWRVSPRALGMSAPFLRQWMFSERAVTMDAWAYPPALMHCGTLAATANATLRIAWETDDPELPKQLTLAFWRVLHTAALEQLATELDCWDLQMWRDVVGGHAGLKRVAAAEMAGNALLEALSADTQRIFLPSLSTVDLLDTLFFKVGTTDPRYPGLPELLAARVEAGCSAMTVTFGDARVRLDGAVELA